MPYCNMSGTIVSPDARHNGDLYNYDDVERNHPEWFLLDRNGQRILDGTFYYLDIGRQDVRERVAEPARLSEPLRARAISSSTTTMYA